MSELTRILSAIEQGDPDSASRLLPLVYDELRKLAAQKLAGEKPGQTLTATALVHEAYLRLVGKGVAQNWSGRGHFFAAAATAMRRILIEQARRKRRHIHGGERRRQDLHPDIVASTGPSEDLLALDAALAKLAERDSIKARLVASPVLPAIRRPESWASRPRQPTDTGPTPGPGSVAKWKATMPNQRIPRISDASDAGSSH